MQVYVFNFNDLILKLQKDYIVNTVSAAANEDLRLVHPGKSFFQFVVRPKFEVHKGAEDTHRSSEILQVFFNQKTKRN